MANTGTFPSKEEVMNERRVQPNKKKYAPPKIFVYGNIGALTRTIGKNGAVDGGSVRNFKNTKA